MKAVVMHEFGPPSVFKNEEIPSPKVQPGHVVIQVKATSVNQIDCKIRSGAVKAIAPPFPAILGCDVAGVVTEVGPQVSHLKAGDEVYACAGGVKGSGGSLAEFMLADASLVAKKPKSFSFIQAAALPLVTITAWTALFLRANIKASQHLLIHGGIGGVGHIALQLAKSVGAKVSTTVGSDDDFPLARKLGAQEVINYRNEQVPQYVQRITAGKGFDVVFDTVGGKNLDLSFEAAALNGVVCTTVSRSMHDLTPLHTKGLSLHVIFMLIPLIYNTDRSHQGEILQKAAKLADEGKLIPLIDPLSFSIAEAAKAHEYLESGKAKGKVVLSFT